MNRALLAWCALFAVLPLVARAASSNDLVTHEIGTDRRALPSPVT